MNKKLLTKTLIASALVLTTVGSGFHSLQIIMVLITLQKLSKRQITHCGKM